jgi:hypothetical protein
LFSGGIACSQAGLQKRQSATSIRASYVLHALLLKGGFYVRAVLLHMQFAVNSTTEVLLCVLECGFSVGVLGFVTAVFKGSVLLFSCLST